MKPWLSQASSAVRPPQPSVVSMGAGLQAAIARLQPLCVTVNVDTAKCVANLDRNNRLVQLGGLQLELDWLGWASG